MIIEPDFADHWKIKALVELTGKPEAPLWLIRLWAHCHSRRAVRFTLPPIALKSICGVSVDISPEDWFKALKECKLIDGTRYEWEVHDWAKHNAKLVANWHNGRSPKAKPITNGASQPEATAKPNPHSPEVGSPDRSDGLEGLEGLEGVDQNEKKELGVLSKRSLSKPASVQEVIDHIKATEGLDLTEADGSAFFYFYESNGWKVGRNPMRNWHAALMTWSRNKERWPGLPGKNSGRDDAPPPAGAVVTNPIIFK